MRISVPLAHAYRLLNHGPLTLISSAHADQRNIMAAAWAMPVDFQPPKVAVVIDKSSHTRQLIEASGHFVLALPDWAWRQRRRWACICLICFRWKWPPRASGACRR